MPWSLLMLYYELKPIIPRSLQVGLRRWIARRKIARCAASWPVCESGGKRPEVAFRWPDNKRFALVLTHDVESVAGVGRCRDLVDLEEGLGFRSSFFFVPELYKIPEKLFEFLRQKGLEIGVHGLHHDGKLYKSYHIFKERSVRINQYLQDWGAVGFRSPSMHHNLDWLHMLDIEYDSSAFDTDPFEPQSDGIGSIFPLWIDDDHGRGYIELPCTLPQDFTLFVVIQQSANVWFRKVDWIAEHGGMVLVLTHPDYMCFDETKPGRYEYPATRYEQLLAYIRDKYKGQYWSALARDVASFWRTVAKVH